MLTTEDIKLIGEELGNVIEHNITPQFDAVHEELRHLGRKIDRVDGKVNVLTNVLLEKHIITDADKHRVLL